MAKTITAKSVQGETLDAVIWRVLGADASSVGEVMSLNRGLAALGPILPAGTQVVLPVKTATVPKRETVQLWD